MLLNDDGSTPCRTHYVTKPKKVTLLALKAFSHYKRFFLNSVIYGGIIQYHKLSVVRLSYTIAMLCVRQLHRYRDLEARKVKEHVFFGAKLPEITQPSISLYKKTLQITKYVASGHFPTHVC